VTGYIVVTVGIVYRQRRTVVGRSGRSRVSVMRGRLIGIDCSHRLTGISSMSQLIVSLKGFSERECLGTSRAVVLGFIQVVGIVVILGLSSVNIQLRTVLEGTVVFVI
jgi:hypothetical protein